MKYLLLEDFIKAHEEEEIWKLIYEYERWYFFEDYPQGSFLWKKTVEYCSDSGIRPFDIRIVAMGAYRHFALKYKETLK